MYSASDGKRPGGRRTSVTVASSHASEDGETHGRGQLPEPLRDTRRGARMCARMHRADRGGLCRRARARRARRRARVHHLSLQREHHQERQERDGPQLGWTPWHRGRGDPRHHRRRRHARARGARGGLPRRHRAQQGTARLRLLRRRPRRGRSKPLRARDGHGWRPHRRGLHRGASHQRDRAFARRSDRQRRGRHRDRPGGARRDLEGGPHEAHAREHLGVRPHRRHLRRGTDRRTPDRPQQAHR